jgi:hypothetical protein
MYIVMLNDGVAQIAAGDVEFRFPCLTKMDSSRRGTLGASHPTFPGSLTYNNTLNFPTGARQNDLKDAI